MDKYTWVDIGSSYLPTELVGAFLYTQLEEAVEITNRRLASWQAYHEAFAELEARGLLRRQLVPDDRPYNAHMY